MKRITMYNSKGDEIVINLETITQFIGENGEEKEYIINTMQKYFSKHKFSEDEEIQNYELKVNEEIVGRGYFNLDLFMHISDIHNQISINKKAVLSEYIVNVINTFELSREMYLLNDYVEKIVCKLNESIEVDSLNIQINSINYEIQDLIKNNLKVNIFDGKYANIDYIKNIDKILCYLEILEKVNRINPEKRLIIFNNIDTYISRDDYKVLVQNSYKICERNDFYFILVASKDGYICLDEELIKGINVINDIIYNVPNVDIIREYVENHYPYYKKISNEDIILILPDIMHKIGKNNKLIDVEAQVILKILNNEEMKETKAIKKPNEIELKYIQK